MTGFQDTEKFTAGFADDETGSPDSILGSALFQSSEAMAYAERLHNLLKEIVEAYSAGHVQMASGDIEIDGQFHPWHEVWIHHASAAVSARESR